MADPLPTFKIVHIPSDVAQPMNEWTVEIPPNEIIECLTNRLKEHFASIRFSDSPEARDSRRQQLRATLSDKLPAGSSLPPDMLEHLLDAGMVEPIPLLINRKDTAFIGVYLYVDDQGTLKNLPMNQRATAISVNAGVPSRVMGDAFLGRMMDDDDAFRRMDFTLEDLNPEAAWWAQARAQHEESGKASDAALQAPTPGLAGSARVQCGEGFLKCKNPAPRKCSRCKQVYYCSAECQRADWKRHKTACQPA